MGCGDPCYRYGVFQVVGRLGDELIPRPGRWTGKLVATYVRGRYVRLYLIALRHNRVLGQKLVYAFIRDKVRH